MKRALWGAGLVLWAVASVVLVGTLMVGHTAAMPGPVSRDVTDAALRPLVPADDAVIHVVPADCSCTDGLVRHLIGRKGGNRLVEHVIFVGRQSAEHLQVVEAGYSVETWAPEDLEERLGLTAGPVLAVRIAGELAYLGGYYRFPAAVRALDETLIDAALAGDRPSTLPLFGCAVAPALRRTVDPLGLQR